MSTLVNFVFSSPPYFLMLAAVVGALIWRFAGTLLDEAAKDVWRVIWDRINRPPMS